MANKKEQEFSYLQMPLPKGQSKNRSFKIDWSGLNYRRTTDTGCLTYEKNISVKEAPYLTPADEIVKKLDFGNIGTTWHTPEDIYDSSALKEMNIGGTMCYGLDFGNETRTVYWSRKSGSNDTLIILLQSGELITSSGGLYSGVKKIYAKATSSKSATSMWKDTVSAIKVYNITDDLSERQKKELNNAGIYYDDYGYIIKNIYSYKNLLFINYYSWFEDNSNGYSEIGQVTANCIIYDVENMQRIKSDREEQWLYYGDFPLADKRRLYSDLPEIKTCVFNMLSSALTLASYKSTSDIIRKVLFFPQSYSLLLDRVENVTYKSGKRFVNDAIHNIYRDVPYPYAFVDSFTDKNVIYNVIENPACKIPKRSDLCAYWQGGSVFYKFDEYYVYPGNPGAGSIDKLVLTDDEEENASWILGYWKFDTTASRWLPYGYDFTEKKKTAMLPLTTKITGTPFLKDVCVHQSRLFGINDIGVYASAYGDYSKWTLDDTDEYNQSNAWMSLMTSDETQSGKPVAIKTYQDTVVVFCENHMYEIRNKKNPFRIIDIYDEGCISSEACCSVNGYLLFANNNGARMYTGGKPKDIGYNLGFDTIYFASCGTDGVNWYLYCETERKEHNLFVYNTVTGLWAEKEIDVRLISFAATSAGVFALDSNNKIYLINSKEYKEQEWACETDFVSSGTVDVKHIKKIQMLAEIGVGSKINVHILRDDEVFDKLSEQEAKERCAYSYTNNADITKTVVIRAVPKRAANYRYKIRISGKGYSKVYQMDVVVQSGGELFNGQV